MSFTFACPDCSQPIQAEKDMAGLHGRCPHCAATFTIPQAGESFSVPHSVEDGFSSGWLTVRSGLFLYRIGLRIAMFALVVAVLLFALGIGLGSVLLRRTELVFQAAMILAGLTLAGATVVMVVGKCLCCAVPEEAATRGLAIGSAGCFISGLLLEALFVLAAFALSRDNNRPGPPGSLLGSVVPALIILAFILNAAAHLLFSLFLKATARFFRNDSLAASATTYLVVYAVFLLSGFMLALLLFLVRLASVDAGQAPWTIFLIVIGVGFLVFALVLMLWFLELVGRMRSTIARSLSEIWKPN